MNAPTHSSAEKAKAPVLAVPEAPTESRVTDPSPTGPRSGSPVSHCITAIKALEQYYSENSVKAPQAFMVCKDVLHGIFVRPSQGPSQPASTKARRLAHTGSVPDSQAPASTQAPASAQASPASHAADKAEEAEFDERKSQKHMRKRVSSVANATLVSQIYQYPHKHRDGLWRTITP